MLAMGGQVCWLQVSRARSWRRGQPQVQYVKHMRILFGAADSMGWADSMGESARRKMRILAAGGDGTVAWILKTVRELGLDPEPPSWRCMPLGTGNDLSLSFGWGNTFLQAWINVRLLSVKCGRPVGLRVPGYQEEPSLTIDQCIAISAACD